MQGTAPVKRDAAPTLGRLLREWRATRGMSQFALAMRAGFSPRHVSFVETGRTQPSREALLTFAEALDVPLRERNRLLEAGGYAHAYPQTPLVAEEMRHLRGVLQFILDRHEPYAAIVLDRYANCVMGNRPSGRLISALVDPSLLTPHLNHLRIAFHPRGARRFIVNWEDVAHHLLARAERDLGSLEGDEQAGALLTELRGRVARSARHRPPAAIEAADLLLPIHVRKDGLDVRMVSTIMTLGTPQDVTLQELRIETFFPADEESARNWPTLLGGQ